MREEGATPPEIDLLPGRDLDPPEGELAPFGDGARFHHVGLAVRSVRATSAGTPIGVEVPQGVACAFVRMSGIRVELLEPLDESSPVTRSVRAGTKLLHLCFEVPDLDRALATGRASGFHALGPPVPSGVFGGRRIAWVLSKEYGLVELLERDAAGSP